MSAPPQSPPQAVQSAKSQAKRARLAEQIADVLLEDGVALIPLRDLAKRLKTSDRMLLYYFDNQADLILASLSCLSQHLSAQLERLFDDTRLSPSALLKKASTVLAQPDIAPTLRVWADVVARGSRNESPFQDLAKASVSGWLSWTAARLAIEDEPERTRMAAALLSVLEGARVIELITPGATQGAVDVWAEALSFPTETLLPAPASTPSE